MGKKNKQNNKRDKNETNGSRDKKPKDRDRAGQWGRLATLGEIVEYNRQRAKE